MATQEWLRGETEQGKDFRRDVCVQRQAEIKLRFRH